MFQYLGSTNLTDFPHYHKGISNLFGAFVAKDLISE